MANVSSVLLYIRDGAKIAWPLYVVTTEGCPVMSWTLTVDQEAESCSRKTDGLTQNQIHTCSSNA